MPSHAESEKVPELTLENYVKVVKTLVDQLNLEKIILCGHSLGGAIAQSYYFSFPDKVEALILVGSGAKLRVSPMILDSLKNDFKAFLESLPAGAFYRKTDKSIIAEVIEATSKIPTEVTYSDFSICDKFDEIARVKNGGILVPTLIIVGNADKLTPVKYSQFFKEYVKNSTMTVVKDAGHMSMLEKPEEVNHAIKEFIKSLK